VAPLSPASKRKRESKDKQDEGQADLQVLAASLSMTLQANSDIERLGSFSITSVTITFCELPSQKVACIVSAPRKRISSGLLHAIYRRLALQVRWTQANKTPSFTLSCKLLQCVTVFFSHGLLFPDSEVP
jgi:hypothetical protein